VKVRHSEGVATRIGPKPCIAVREGSGEASAGVRIGQPLSRERRFVSGADVVGQTEGRTDGSVSASNRTTRRGLRPWHVRKFLARETGGLTFGHRRKSMVRIGKARSRSR
jgi:hypothetical protein